VDAWRAANPLIILPGVATSPAADLARRREMDREPERKAPSGPAAARCPKQPERRLEPWAGSSRRKPFETAGSATPSGARGARAGVVSRHVRALSMLIDRMRV
jgi:hypothetical protein